MKLLGKLNLTSLLLCLLLFTSQGLALEYACSHYFFSHTFQEDQLNELSQTSPDDQKLLKQIKEKLEGYNEFIDFVLRHDVDGKVAIRRKNSMGHRRYFRIFVKSELSLEEMKERVVAYSRLTTLELNLNDSDGFPYELLGIKGDPKTLWSEFSKLRKSIAEIRTSASTGVVFSSAELVEVMKQGNSADQVIQNHAAMTSMARATFEDEYTIIYSVKEAIIRGLTVAEFQAEIFNIRAEVEREFNGDYEYSEVPLKKAENARLARLKSQISSRYRQELGNKWFWQKIKPIQDKWDNGNRLAVDLFYLPLGIHASIEAYVLVVEFLKANKLSTGHRSDWNIIANSYPIGYSQREASDFLNIIFFGKTF